MHSKSINTRYEPKRMTHIESILIYATLIFRASEVDQMKNEVINLKSQVSRLNQERDELFAKIEEEESKSIVSVAKVETEKEELGNKLSMAIEKNASMEKELLGKV